MPLGDSILDCFDCRVRCAAVPYVAAWMFVGLEHPYGLGDARHEVEAEVMLRSSWWF